MNHGCVTTGFKLLWPALTGHAMLSLLWRFLFPETRVRKIAGV